MPDAKPILVACCFPFLYGNPPLFRVISSIAFFLPRTEFSCCDVLFVDIPEGVDYRLEDGEIGAGELEDYEQLSEQEEQDGEYDPLMAGSVESDDNGSGPESPDDIASPQHLHSAVPQLFSSRPLYAVRQQVHWKDQLAQLHLSVMVQPVQWKILS